MVKSAFFEPATNNAKKSEYRFFPFRSCSVTEVVKMTIVDEIVALILPTVLELLNSADSSENAQKELDINSKESVHCVQEVSSHEQ